MTLRRLLLCLALLFCAGGLRAAQADPLVLTLTNPTQAALPGQSATFIATAFNSGATSASTVTISSINVVAFGVTITPNFNNFAGLPVAAGDTLGPLPLFTLTVLGDVPLGTVISGTVTLGYNNESATSNSAPFTLTVASPTAAVPEPVTMVLFGTGLVGVIGAARRRHSKAARGE